MINTKQKVVWLNRLRTIQQKTDEVFLLVMAELKTSPDDAALEYFTDLIEGMREHNEIALHCAEAMLPTPLAQSPSGSPEL